MTAVNAGVHELTGVRLPLQPYTGGHAVFMYSTAADGNVTLQLKEPDDLDRGSLAAMLARLQDDATFSISYQDTDILSDGSIDVLLGTGSTNSLQTTAGNESVSATFDIFDSSSGPDLTLSPQTFTNSAEAFINENSNSLGVPAENETVSSTDDKKGTQGTTAAAAAAAAAADAIKLGVKRARPKAASPNRQGPQQCQVCAKVFGNASALAKHKLTHSDERKYVCTMCGKAFKRQDHLNGHMLTHRNKKPYECKADGCGKSYCDARSLRRHTENHHSSTSTTTTTTTTTTTVNATTTMSPAQGAASGDAASPHGSSCIQYAPPPTNNNTGKTHLQQLLATEPVKSGNGGNNDGLTKQQLDLIHQIMEQTQRQSQPPAKSTTKPSTKPTSKTPAKSRVWSSSAQQNSTTKGNGSASQNKVSSSGGGGSSKAPAAGGEPKPVECNLCHRKFKNIPALNGHMRLHGGYFKKDADNKKCEKKDAAGPPLQTASVSVRALIEEKIINKRTNAPPTPTTNAPATSSTAPTPKPKETAPVSSPPQQSSSLSSSPVAPPLFPLTVHSSGGGGDLDSKITSFVVPAPPQTEKARRHSDAEAFTVPRAPNTTQQEAEALADLILRKDKVAVKRTTSDPGQPSQIIQFQAADSFTLSYQSENGGYLSSDSLQDEVFNQVQDSMLLQAVDAQQLASIGFQPESLLQDQSLDDYASLQDQSPSYQSTHSVNQELQAVLDSPLPESLAEFSTFHSTTSLDIPSPNYQTQSPRYSASPHTSIATQSPLQSPLIRHDSPGFAYPTPPASHEGQSPCFGQNTLLPMVSPKQNDFAQVVPRDLDEPPQASSPLSAAFFTSTMSSSAAVEEALEEVLPGESIAADELYPSLTNSPPPPQSPLSVGLTPVASPLSNIPTTSSASTSNTNPFPLSPHYTFQSQMLPNSDDPLLSSSPKDFATRKRFEFNGLPLKVISNNGLLDLNSTNLTGILVESNGEIKFIQTGGGVFQGKNIIVTGAPIITSQVIETQKVVKTTAPVKQMQQRPKLTLECIKQEESNDVFLSPTTIPASPVRPSRKRPRSEPLQLPILHQSRLRATRSKPQGSAPYTPSPILNPNRPGSGLYFYLKQKTNDIEDPLSSWSSEFVPESDSTPHVNIGPQYQCSIPPLTPAYHRTTRERAPEDLLWDPGIAHCTDNEVDMYLDFACCAAVPGGGRNHEYAMHLLHLSNGSIQEAMLKLMQPTPALPSDHPLLHYHYADSDKWTPAETEIFHHALHKYDKDFYLISQEVVTKTVKQCVQFYYMWKKVCTDEYRRLKQFRERRLGKSSDFEEEKPFPDAKLLGIADTGSPMPIQEHRNFICEFSDCSASFNSRAALNSHIRIHGGAARCSPTPSPQTRQSLGCHSDTSVEDYPCKICGKVFTKIKSRSAHMKSHRPSDAEPIRRREKDPVSSTTFESVPSPYST